MGRDRTRLQRLENLLPDPTGQPDGLVVTTKSEKDERGITQYGYDLEAGGSGGGVTAVTATAPIASSGGTTPDISLANSAVTPGSYTNANITVDAHGLVTAAANGSAGTGTVTSVSGSGGSTGLTLTGGPITTSGTLTLGGTLAIASGGTGQITRQAALNALAGTMTKGDILVSTGANVVTHAHGTNGAIIQFDSSQTDGLVNIFSPFLPYKTLQAEIMADSPTGYWRYNDTSGTTIVDSSGNGFNLTQQGTAGTGSNYVLAYQALQRLQSSPDLYVNNINTGGGCQASINPTGASVPSGSWTVMGIARRSQSANICPFLQINNNASSSNAIYCGLQTAGSGPFVQLTGTNFTIQAYTATISNNNTYIFHYVKDASAKTFTFYINGFLMGVTSYPTEFSTTLTTPRTYIGRDFSGTATTSGIMGEVALFYGQTLSLARVQAHAQAAGLYGL